MNIKQRILRTEDEFPKRFASCIEKDYGILFYNDNNIGSHDSNHAILHTDKIFNMEYVLCNIKDFYLSKGITPRVYHPSVTGYFETHRGILEKLGYKIEIYENNRFMLLTQENNINIESRLEIKRILEWDDRIANDIFIPNGEEYEIEVLKDSIKHKDTYMFVGYLNGVAVSNIHFHISKYGCTRFDYITTAKRFRGKGHAREILSYVVDYCKENNITNCYQWPANESSEKICHEAGFRVIFEMEAGSAVCPQNEHTL